MTDESVGQAETKGAKHKPSGRGRVARGLIIWSFVLLGQLLFALGKRDSVFIDWEEVACWLFLVALMVTVVAAFVCLPGSAGRKVITFILVILLLLIVVFLFVPSLSSRVSARSVVCLANLRQWCIGAYCYCADNDGALPSADGLGRMGPYIIADRELVCPYDRQARSDDPTVISSYAINVEACGKKIDELPDDMVLFFGAELDEQRCKEWKRKNAENNFESEQKTNSDTRIIALYGGPELISYRHVASMDNRVCCVFADGSCSWVDNPFELRWYIDENKKIDDAIVTQVTANYRRHRVIFEAQQKKAYCEVGLWLAWPYVVWAVIVVIIKICRKKAVV